MARTYEKVLMRQMQREHLRAVQTQLSAWNLPTDPIETFQVEGQNARPVALAKKERQMLLACAVVYVSHFQGWQKAADEQYDVQHHSLNAHRLTYHW